MKHLLHIATADDGTELNIGCDGDDVGMMITERPQTRGGQSMRQDRFFTQRTCDRCYKPLDGGRIMSRFNTDCICMECAHKERERSDYRKAADAEQEAVYDSANYPVTRPSWMAQD